MSDEGELYFWVRYGYIPKAGGLVIASGEEEVAVDGGAYVSYPVGMTS